MWNDEKRERFNTLRSPLRALTGDEQAELASLEKELVETKDSCLKHATERLRQENDILEKTLQRRRDLVDRLEQLLAEAQAENRAIFG